MKPLGIFGGTFDPIHYGHLRPAREAMTALGLREMRFIPAANPPHRRAPQAAASDRLAMVRLAIADQTGFVVDDRELKRGGPSYTVLTLEELRAELGNEIPLCLLIGADAFTGFETWHQWQRIPELAHLAVVHRPDSAVTDDPGTWPAWARDRACNDPGDLARAAAGRIVLVNVTPQNISATHLRERIARGESPEGALPPAVWRYIVAQRLYATPQSRSLERHHS